MDRFAGSNPAEGMDVLVYLLVLCRWRPRHRADHSFRGVLPSVYLIVRNTETLKMKPPSSELSCSATNIYIYIYIYEGLNHTIPDIEQRKAMLNIN